MGTAPPIDSKGLSQLEAVRLSQQAPRFLKQNNTSNVAGISALIPTSSTADVYNDYEKLFIACLRTGDDKAAHKCLERLIERFGPTNERIMGLRGLYQEAVASDQKGLETILQEYQSTLADDKTNTPLMKRRAALLQSLGRPAEAINALVELLGSSPTDIEAWAELSDLYLDQGLLRQACFCLEEILLVAPNAWNIHARLGELLILSSITGDTELFLNDSIRRCCRSIELCDGFLRGFYGLKLSTDRLLKFHDSESKKATGNAQLSTSHSELPNMSRSVAQVLNKKAERQLADIVHRYHAGQLEYQYYEPSEIRAVEELLSSKGNQ